MSRPVCNQNSFPAEMIEYPLQKPFGWRADVPGEDFQSVSTFLRTQFFLLGRPIIAYVAEQCASLSPNSFDEAIYTLPSYPEPGDYQLTSSVSGEHLSSIVALSALLSLPPARIPHTAIGYTRTPPTSRVRLKRDERLYANSKVSDFINPSLASVLTSREAGIQNMLRGLIYGVHTPSC
jgi:hypothetical protein